MTHAIETRVETAVTKKLLRATEMRSLKRNDFIRETIYIEMGREITLIVLSTRNLRKLQILKNQIGEKGGIGTC